MPSTYSPDLRVELIANGEQSGSWGATTNSNLGTILEDAISGLASVTTASANQALTALNGAADQARCAALDLDTLTGANFNVYVPPVTKLYVVKNSSAYTATVYCSTVIGNTTAAGTGVAIPAGKTVLLRSDGTDIVEQLNQVVGALSVGGALAVGGTLTASGALAVGGTLTATSPTFSGVPTAPTAAQGTNTTQIATTQFVRTEVGTALQDPGANGVLVRTAASTTTARTITAGNGIAVTNGNGVSGNPTIAQTYATSSTIGGVRVDVSGTTLNIYTS